MSSDEASSEEELTFDSHTIFCEILSSYLGVTCCARVVLSALLTSPLSRVSLDEFLQRIINIVDDDL